MEGPKPILKDPSEVSEWTESDVPLSRRGVSVEWLVAFVNAVQQQISPRPETAIPSYEMGMAELATTPVLMNGHAFVEHVVKPLTVGAKAPLYAFVPEWALGVPDVFLSHPWAGLLVGSTDQGIGTIDALESPLLIPRPKYVWIDFVCYNQHLIESIALDMEDVIGKIGQLGFLCSPIPILGRTWCLWELLCSERAGASTQVYVRAGFRNDKILATNALKRSFIGVRESQTTVQRDHDEISEAFLTYFGSFEAADTHVEKLIEERLSAPIFELHERSDDLQFRPYPFVYDGGSDEAGKAAGVEQWRTFKPYYTRYLRSSILLGTSDRIFGHLIDAGLQVSEEEQSARELETAAPELLAAFRAVAQGDEASLEKLISDGLDVNSAVLLGRNLLALAAAEGHASTVERLLAMGADVDAGPPKGISALTGAAQSGAPETVTLLLRAGADPDLAGPHGNRPLHQAALRGHEAAALILLDAGAAVSSRAENDATPLHMAADGGHIDIVRLLLGRGAPIDDADGAGWTALLWAASHGHLAVVQELASRGADIDVVTSKASSTPLHLAAKNGHATVVRWLLEAGVAPDPVTQKGQTPLHLALREGHVEIVELLLAHGAPTDCADETGETPLTLSQKVELPESVLKRLQAK